MDSIVIISIIVLLIIGYILHKQNVEFVRNNSICLRNIKSLNSKQNFRIFNTTESYQKCCNSKQQFDNFNKDNYIMSIIDNNLDRYIKTIDDLKFNWKKYTSYQSQFNSILNYSYDYKPITQKTFLNEFFFRKLEIIECEKEKLKPSLELTIQLSVVYTSPQGRNFYSKSCRINSNNIEYYCNECIRSRQYKQSAKYQRSLMTDKLRYQVLNRDGHRCVICGASARDGVKLHVDHIIPVSKGGKTEMSNLRTLCERCNLGKGASYNPNGYN